MTFLAYGLAAGVAQIPDWSAWLMTLLVFASPAQFAMADVAAQGGGVVQLVTIAVVVNLRFFVMSLTLVGTFDRRRQASHLLWCQFVSATTYLMTFLHWRRGEVEDAFVFYQGVVLAAVPGALIGTAVGLWFGSAVPALVAFGATLFLPAYFSLLIVGERLSRKEFAAVVLGFVLTPPFELLLPGWGLFVVALGVGIVLYAGSSDE
jgi:predicted branched-subunit amino acid permease